MIAEARREEKEQSDCMLFKKEQSNLKRTKLHLNVLLPEGSQTEICVLVGETNLEELKLECEMEL